MLISVLHTSGSGLRAEARAVEASAANIANQRTSSRVVDAQSEAARVSGGNAGSSYDGYKPVTVDRTALAGGGVRAEFRETSDFYSVAFDPSDVNANAEGVVALPKVDLGQEFVTMTVAQNAYEANAAAFRTADEMLGELLDRKV